ncbi:MAG: AAA family ATPase [Candidatus Peribacteria bacterium]|nr:MAG: AAA family ATPase [Candidatus Peribacteria bacterium]
MFQFRKIHIENFRTIESEEILFGENKTVFVGKNDAGKSNILKAIRMLFHQENKKIKKSYFRDPAKEICVRGEVMYNEKIYEFTCRASLHREKVEFSYDPMDDETMSVFQNINLIYIPSNRKLDTKDPDNGYNKLINLILENKENREFYDPVSVQQEGFDDIANKDDTEKTMFIISLLKLYLYSIRGANQKRCNIFLIDQPENFLHPHGTKLIDRLLQQISELSHAQILYSTHSSELVSNFKKGKYELQDIVFVRRIDGVTKIKRIENKYGRYNKIMISLIFKNGSVFFSDAVILVEGETEKISIPNIYENWDWRTEIKQGED